MNKNPDNLSLIIGLPENYSPLTTLYSLPSDHKLAIFIKQLPVSGDLAAMS